MKQGRCPDPEYQELLLDFVRYGVLPSYSEEADITLIVAAAGVDALSPYQRSIWEQRILPTVCKPLSQQIAIASILDNGGYVPCRIDVTNLEASLMDREVLLKRLDRAQAHHSNRQRDIVGGSAQLENEALQRHVERWEAVTSAADDISHDETPRK